MKLKKKRTIRKFDNVVVFPGTGEILLRDAQNYVANLQYELAVEKFEAAFELVDGDEHSLTIFAFALYETKQFEKATNICEQLLETGPSNYFEVMELYLTACMQLKQYEKVNKIIQTLLEEGVVPDERIENFERLGKLNAEIAENKKFQEEATILSNVEFSAQSFIELTPQEQLVMVNELTMQNIRPISDEIKWVIEQENTNVFIKSLLLILLVEQQVDTDVVVSKLGNKKLVNPKSYPLPTDLPMYQNIMKHVLINLEKEPSIQQLAEHLITKHAIVAYPFGWEPYTADEIANAYSDFVKIMFGELTESNEGSIELLQQFEILSEI